MGDLEWILLVLATFYVVETAHWVLPGTVLFVGHGGRSLRPRLLDNTPAFRNAGGGVLFGSLLPWGEAVLAKPCPVSLCEDALLGFTGHHLGHDARPGDDGPEASWESARDAVADGREVRIAGRRFAAADSPRAAVGLAAELQRLAKADPAHRRRLIEAFVAGWFDEEKLTKDYAASLRATRFLRITCTLLFLHFFVLLPLMIWRGWGVFFLVWVVIYGALLLLNLVAFAAAHRTLRPTARGERWKRALLMLISPADAARSRSLLFYDLAALRHPLCVAFVLCSADDAAFVARRTLRDLRRPQDPLCPSSETARRIEASFRERLLDEALRCVRRRGLDPAELERPPKREAADGVAYCPRCEQQFRDLAGTCAVCGLAASAFPDPAEP